MIAAAQDAAVATKTQEHPKPDTFNCIKDAREARDKLNEGEGDKDKKAIVFAYNICEKFSGKHLKKELLSGRSNREVLKDCRNVYAYYVATVDEMLQYAHQELLKGSFHFGSASWRTCNYWDECQSCNHKSVRVCCYYCIWRKGFKL